MGPLGETDNPRTHTQGTREPQSGEIYRELGLLQPSEGRSGDPEKQEHQTLCKRQRPVASQSVLLTH